MYPRKKWGIRRLLPSTSEFEKKPCNHVLFCSVNKWENVWLFDAGQWRPVQQTREVTLLFLKKLYFKLSERSWLHPNPKTYDKGSRHFFHLIDNHFAGYIIWVASIFLLISPSPDRRKKKGDCTMLDNQAKAAAVANSQVTTAFGPKEMSHEVRNYLNNEISCFWSVQFFC